MIFSSQARSSKSSVIPLRNYMGRTYTSPDRERTKASDRSKCSDKAGGRDNNESAAHSRITHWTLVQWLSTNPFVRISTVVYDEITLGWKNEQR